MYCYPFYGYQGNNSNDSNWVWGIIIVAIIIYFLFWGSNSRPNCNQKNDYHN